MPRRPRLILPEVPLHVIQRGNNRQACFFSEEDYHCYLSWLGKYAKDSGCMIHAYVLMTNHVHLLLTPLASDSVSMLMKRLGQRYVQYINRTYRRSGTLWEGRFRSCLTQEDKYVLSCYRYIELNPVRARMVDHPGEYPWSSYRVNAQGDKSDIVVSHRIYAALGSNDRERTLAYRELFRYQLDPELIDQIRASTNGNFALGSSQFKEEIAKTLGRRVSPAKSGRPRKLLKLESVDLFEDD